MFAFSIVFFSMDFLRHCMVLILILGTIVGIMVAMMLIIMSMSVTALMVIVGMMMMVLLVGVLMVLFVWMLMWMVILFMRVFTVAVMMMLVVFMFDFNVLISLVSDALTYLTCAFLLQRFKSFCRETVISVVHLFLFGFSICAFLYGWTKRGLIGVDVAFILMSFVSSVIRVSLSLSRVILSLFLPL